MQYQWLPPNHTSAPPPKMGCWTRLVIVLVTLALVAWLIGPYFMGEMREIGRQLSNNHPGIQVTGGAHD